MTRTGSGGAGGGATAWGGPGRTSKAHPWPIGFHTTYVLLTEGGLEQMAGTRRIVALAIPAQNLILLDLSKMARHTFVLETTMKHELCHLLLHSYIHGTLLPKWLDEGVCQWASNGMAEIIMEPKSSSLKTRCSPEDSCHLPA